MCVRFIIPLFLFLLTAAVTLGQDRDTKVRNDREAFKSSERWVYNDLAQGIAEAARTNKPLLVVFRCIPCEACAGFDEQVARRDPRIDDLMDKFVCVRIVHANGMDLDLFQFDYDMSFAAFFLNADRTIYGRFGSMSNHDDAERDISMEGFRKTLLGALEVHKGYPANKASLAGKHGPPARFKSPELYPTMKRYTAFIDYEGKVAQSCIHCHSVRDVERQFLHEQGETFSDAVLYPWPMPNAVGLALDRKERAKVVGIIQGSLAEQAGFHTGDELVTLEGQPLLSIADVQWVIHTAPEPATLKAEVIREGKNLTLALPLAKGWRRTVDFSWRPTTWALRAFGTGGMLLVELSPEERKKAGLRDQGMALRAKHVGEYGNHAAAKRAGFQKDDVLVSLDGQTSHKGESDFLVYMLRQKKVGDQVPVTVLRSGKRIDLKLPVQ